MTLPVTAELLADPADLAALTGLPADNSRLVASLLSASRRFAGAVRHPVRLIESDTIVLDGNGTTTLLLPAAPVTAVTSVAVNGETLAPDTYAWSADGLLERADPWPRARRAVHVVYSHGYDPIPGMVADAVLQAAHIALNTEPGLSTVSVGSMSLSFSTRFGGAVAGATDTWAAAVETYRLNRGERV